MKCPNCQTDNAPGATTCLKCQAPLGGHDAQTMDGVSDSSLKPLKAQSKAEGAATGHGEGVRVSVEAPRTASDAQTMDGVSDNRLAPMTGSRVTPVTGGAGESQAGSLLVLKPGSLLGGRYEILGLLGVGGMGAVYKAKDREVDRLVVLKVIRPELAGNAEILQRFKQELILARQITHKNVIRIYDLGEADGIKFISMEYIEGKDLRTALTERGKFPPEEAAQTICQVSEALEAAHTEGVVHRDLKPQNIMVDKQGRVTVMDFGIARSMEQPGMTQTGAIIGTPEYMSPEQAKGEDTDARSDLFSLGIIFYELLTGKTPYHAPTAVAMLVKRTQERAVPPSKLDPAVPKYINDVVVKCLEIDRTRRYQKASEIAADLQAHHAPRPGPLTLRMPRFRVVEEFPTKWLGPGLGLLALVIILVVFRGRLFERASPSKPAQSPVSLAILPFHNASGDPALDWLGPGLPDMLRTDMGQSAHLRTVSSDSVDQVLHDLRVTPGSTLDPDTFRRVAEFTNADKLVWGQISKSGDRIRIDATLRDPAHERNVPLQVEAPSDKELPSAIAQLAQSIEKNLSFSPDIIKELQAQALKPSTNSLAALRGYNEGRELARQGRSLDAVKKFQAATEADPQFALAFSELALVDHILGYDDQAGQYSRKAMDLSASLPPQEKYLIQANHARIVSDNQKAIEAYENLVKASPNDLDIQLALAKTYEAAGSFEKARDRYAQVLKADPKNVGALFGRGETEIGMGNYQGSLDYLNQALSLSIQLENDEERAQVLFELGLAYSDLNKPQDALRNLQDSLEISRRQGNKPEVAHNLEAMAEVQDNLGESAQAERNYREAEQLSQEIGDKKGLGGVLIDLGAFYGKRGQVDKALDLFKQSLQIQRDLGNYVLEAMCLGNIGGTYEDKGDYESALIYFQQALQVEQKLQVLSPMGDTLSNLGETSAKIGQYDQAVDYYLKDLDLQRKMGDKRGVAVASAGLGTVYEYQGKYGAALAAQQDAVKTLQTLGSNPPELPRILAAEGYALTLVGRWGEAEKTLDGALSGARQLKDDSLIAEILGFQGDNFFYRGDFKAAEPLFAQGLQAALRGKNRGLILISKFNLAKVAVKTGRARAAVGSLKALAQEADTMGLRFISVEASVYLAEAFLDIKDYPHAREELERALARSDKLGLRSLVARSHFLLAETLARAGNGAEAAPHYAEARRILDAIQKEAGNDSILKRSDLSPIAAGPPARPAAGPA